MCVCHYVIKGFTYLLSYSSRSAIWRVIVTRFPNLPLFDVPARGNRLEYLDETCPEKTRGMRLLHVEMHDPSFNSY